MVQTVLEEVMTQASDFTFCRRPHLHTRRSSKPVTDAVRMRWSFDQDTSEYTVAQLQVVSQ